MTASTTHSSATRTPRRSSRPAPQPESPRAANPNRASDFRPARLVLTDDDLRRHVSSRLSQFGPQIARAVTACVRHGDVMLIGDVGSDYERRLVEHSIARLAGVASLENRLRVRSGGCVATENAGRAVTTSLAIRTVVLAAGATGVVAAGWGVWLLAAACTG